MPRRKGSEAENAAKKQLEVRLEFLIRNDLFKQDLVKGQELYAQYRNAPSQVYAPLYANPYVALDSRRQSYQEAIKNYPSFEESIKKMK